MNRPLDEAGVAGPVPVAPSGPAPGGPAPAPDAGRAGVSAERIEELLQLFEKCLRAYRMYQSNNPVYQGFVERLRAAFVELWTEAPELRFTVEEDGLVYEGRTYAVGEGRESLAFQFFKDGVRFVTFLRGFEDEVEAFLELVHGARQLGLEDEDDLVTLLWEREFTSFRYGYVDVLAEGFELPDAPEVPELNGIPQEVLRAEVADQGAEEAEPDAAAAPPPDSATFSREDFKETLYFLDPDEFQLLRAELEDEWRRDLEADVLYALFDRLEDPVPERQAEVLSILRQLLPVFLGRGQLRLVAMVLTELEGMRSNAYLLGPEQEQEVERLLDELSDPAVLEPLIRLLDDGAIVIAGRELSSVIGRLRPHALPALLRATETAAAAATRERLAEAVGALGAKHEAHVLELLGAADAPVRMGAVRLTGRLRLGAAVSPLARLLDAPEPTLRHAVVEALLAIRTAEALEALLRALKDPAREVRLAAARGLGALHYAPAASQLEAAITGRAMRTADLTEKLAFFQAYAAVAGGEAVPVLDRLLNARRSLGRRLPAELRACAATALGQVGTPPARSALERAANDQDAVIRGAVVRALRNEAAS
ncbi:MAG TPA: HEAT repeat domain-containing protein [Longimicrobiales bacterium]